MDVRGVSNFALFWLKGIIAFAVMLAFLAVIAIVNPFWLGLLIYLFVIAAIVTGYVANRRRRSQG
jgi:energy-coupling factor transporter transmembrane protein EcfT